MGSKNAEHTLMSGQESILLPLLVVSLIVMTLISSSSDISLGLLGNVIAFGIYLLVLASIFAIHEILYLPKEPTMAFGVIYLLFIIGFIRDVSGFINHPESYTYPISDIQLALGTANIIGYILGSFVLVFLIPKYFKQEWFFATIVLASSVSILVGLPAYITGNYSLLGVHVNTYTALEPLRQFGIQIPALASFWGDANAMSKITVAGLFGSHYLYSRQKSSVNLLLIGLNAFGLFLANSRMSIIAVTVAYSVYFVYRVFDNTATVVYLLVSGFTGSILFLLIALGIGTDGIIPSSGFSGRIPLWKGSIVSFFKYPLIGIGIHNVGEAVSANTGVSTLAPQNSYLRIFVAGGIVGGTLYISTILSATLQYVTTIKSEADLLTLSLLIAFTLIQFTDTAHPFGVNKSALIFGATLGYVIDQVYAQGSS